jgi:hypothetical protein
MKLIFISGKYRGKDWNEIDANIQKAKEASIKLWQQGYAVFCAHMNTAHFDGLCPDEVWLKGDIEILKRCDAIFVLKNWQSSEGAKEELRIARKLGMEIIFE